jgi:hypothetical protein
MVGLTTFNLIQSLVWVQSRLGGKKTLAPNLNVTSILVASGGFQHGHPRATSYGGHASLRISLAHILAAKVNDSLVIAVERGGFSGSDHWFGPVRLPAIIY